MTANTYGTDYGTIVSAYDETAHPGSPPFTAAMEVGCNDSGANSQVTIPVTSGHLYYFMVVAGVASVPPPDTLHFNLIPRDLTGLAQDLSAVEGASTGLVPIATFTDNDGDPCSAYSVSIDLHDGGATDASNPQTGLTCTSPLGNASIACQNTGASTQLCTVYASTAYAEELVATPYSISVTDSDTETVANPSGVPLVLQTSALAAPQVTVSDAPLNTVANNTGAITTVANQPFTAYLGTIHDADPGCLAADYTTLPGGVTITWGDGSTSAGSVQPSTVHPGTCNFDVFGTHTYTDGINNHNIQTTVTDQGGSSTALSDNTNTANFAGNTITPVEQTALPGNTVLATFTD
ncbi:MAG: hypothetical protein ACRDFX_07170, partial [Chloroflexota bacterium]